jgi:hypothetical protein
MKIDDYKNLEEIISKEDFQNMIMQLIINREEYDVEILIEILETLSEKYVKFRDNILSCNQVDIINDLLILSTNFSNLSRMQILISILFNFRIDKYYDYLNKHKDTIVNIEVKNEVFESLIEYQPSKNYK